MRKKNNRKLVFCGYIIINSFDKLFKNVQYPLEINSLGRLRLELFILLFMGRVYKHKKKNIYIRILNLISYYYVLDRYKT